MPKTTEVLRRVNYVLNLQNIIATAIVGIVNPAAREMELARAGHSHPIMRSRDGVVRQIAAGGALLGALDHLYCETSFINIEPGTTSVFYTDGLIESCGDIGLGLQQLLHVVKHDDGPVLGQAKRICDAMLSTVTQTDDVAVIVLAFDLVPSRPEVPPSSVAVSSA